MTYFGLFFHGVRVTRLSRVAGLLLGDVGQCPVSFTSVKDGEEYLAKNLSPRLLGETRGAGFTIRQI